MYFLFIAGAPGGDLAFLWSLRQAEPKTLSGRAATNGTPPVEGIQLVFSATLTPQEEADVLALVADPPSWNPAGSYLVADLPVGTMPGANTLWAQDAEREGGGVGTLVYFDGVNWLRVSDNTIAAVPP